MTKIKVKMIIKLKKWSLNKIKIIFFFQNIIKSMVKWCLQIENETKMGNML